VRAVRPVAIIPTYLRTPQEFELLLRCLVSVTQTAPDVTPLVVDDGSPARDLVAQLEPLTREVGAELILKAENTGFSKTVNAGLTVARDAGADAVLVNQDIQFIRPGWFEAMDACCGPDGRPASVVGAKLLFPSLLLQHAGVYYSRLYRLFDHRWRMGPHDLPEANVPAAVPVTGALQLIRHDCLVDVGLYDDSFDMGWEDVDYCIRTFAAGRFCMYEPQAVAVHHESAIRGNDDDARHAQWFEASRARLAGKYTDADFARFAHDLVA
jgi:GT2 family glycosyltransferase